MSFIAPPRIQGVYLVDVTGLKRKVRQKFSSPSSFTPKECDERIFFQRSFEKHDNDLEFKRGLLESLRIIHPTKVNTAPGFVYDLKESGKVDSCFICTTFPKTRIRCVVAYDKSQNDAQIGEAAAALRTAIVDAMGGEDGCEFSKLDLQDNLVNILLAVDQLFDEGVIVHTSAKLVSEEVNMQPITSGGSGIASMLKSFW
eukprot:TRINITY_DN775833_c0_g1_i1.p1 TRINITY_DN775833_c0_g1~~TRINITY_DN775833_c0_g1_i1.p1  ORF type:complete len:200 (+),score=32.10 TRINITY_DN775833_c0_g1_i1:41-640(+)